MSSSTIRMGALFAMSLAFVAWSGCGDDDGVGGTDSGVGTDAGPGGGTDAGPGGGTDAGPGGGTDAGPGSTTCVGAEYFCMGQMSICMFGKGAGHYLDDTACRMAYCSYSAAKEMCVANALGRAATDAAECVAATGGGACADL